MRNFNTDDQVKQHGWQRRPKTGLTTLEWLLIVAAVAGLAALAVVLVQNVVDDTAEEISGNNARVTAANVAADRITSDARAELPAVVATNKAAQADYWEKHAATQELVDREFGSKCNRLSITYSDADIKANWHEVKLASGAGAMMSGTLSGHDSAGKAWTDADSKDKTEARCEATQVVSAS